MARVSACKCNDDLLVQACNISAKCSSIYRVINVIKRWQKAQLMGLNVISCMSKQISWPDLLKFSSHCVEVMEGRWYPCHIGSWYWKSHCPMSKLHIKTNMLKKRLVSSQHPVHCSHPNKTHLCYMCCWHWPNWIRSKYTETMTCSKSAAIALGLYKQNNANAIYAATLNKLISSWLKWPVYTYSFKWTLRDMQKHKTHILNNLQTDFEQLKKAKSNLKTKIQTRVM